MAQYKEQAHVRDVPVDVIIHSIEAICEGLIQDARYNYGREAGYGSHLLVNEAEGFVFCEVKFIPYKYRFRWLVEKEKDGFLVTLVGSTPNAWYEFLTRQSEKLRGLMDVQWSAFVNFSIGYVTCNYYVKNRKSKAPNLPAKVHIKKAGTRVKKRSQTKQKKTKIDSG